MPEVVGLVVVGSAFFAATLFVLHRLVPPHGKSKQGKLHEAWLDDIAEDKRFDLKSLLEHVHHHTDEGLQEGVGPEWLASMVNLLAIIRRKQSLNSPSTRMCLQRLFLHWQKDPQNTTPPPLLKSLDKLVANWAPPPEEKEQAPKSVEKQVEEFATKTEEHYNSNWHGS